MRLSPTDGSDKSIRVQLLADIQTVFEDKSTDKISSADLCDALAAMEDRPWCEWGRTNKPIKPSALSRQLKHYQLAPSTIRIGTTTIKGYLKSKLEDAFYRYIPHTPDSKRHTSQVNEIAGYSDFSAVTHTPKKTRNVTQNPSISAGCDGVAAGSGVSGGMDTNTASKCRRCGVLLEDKDKGLPSNFVRN